MILAVVLASLLGGAAAVEEVRAAVILPQDPHFVVSIPKVMPVLRLAAHRAAPLLPGRRLVFYPADDNCDSDLALRNAVTAKMCPDDINRLHVFFGPTCEYCVGECLLNCFIKLFACIFIDQLPSFSFFRTTSYFI